MVCRSTPGMSVPMGLANIDSGLDDDQIQSLVHQLRHEYVEVHHHGAEPEGGHQQPGASAVDPSAAWDRFRASTAMRITGHPGLRPQRRVGLLRRITQAEATPPADMVYAAERIRDRAIRAARLMDDHLATEAARIGVPDHDALASYEQGRHNARTGRRARATEEQRRAWPGLPLDPRTRHGLAALAARHDNPDGRRELIDDHRYVQATDPAVVAGTGYHPGSGRLEIVTPDGAVLAYRQVPPAVAEQLRTGQDPDQVYRDHVQGNPAFQYRDAVQAAAAGVRRRCADCGQFTGATHNCLGRRGGIRAGALGPVTPLFPTPLTNQVLPRIGDTDADLPVRIAPLDQVIGGLERVRGEGVEFPFQATYPSGEHLTGSLSGALDTDDHISINGAHLTCSCDGYAPGQGCPHIQAAATGVRDALTQQLIDSRGQTAAATGAAITGGSTTRPATEAALPDSPNLSTLSYAQDSGRFADDVRAALSRPADQQVPWIEATDTDPGLYGYGATREFGVELEFDVHNHAPRYGDLELDQRIDYRYRTNGPRSLAVGRVARALYEDNFTTHDRQSGYHSGLQHGYQRNLRGGWMYEHDGSVNGGEVVSPILSDTPETWQRLHQACGIITRHGGTASPNTGSHITVSAPEQAGRAVRLTRFLRLMHHHQRDLHVMAAAGRGRGQGYSAAMPAPPDQGYTTISDARQLLGRYSFANIAHIAPSRNSTTANSSRVEFRLWDGSLEPGRIQAQIKMSTAMLDYTARNRDLVFPADERTPAGTLNPDRAEFAEHTGQIRGLIDELFRRDIDKQQAAALWAAGLGARNYTREYLR
jgi:hypothetical protein